MDVALSLLKMAVIWCRSLEALACAAKEAWLRSADALEYGVCTSDVDIKRQYRKTQKQLNLQVRPGEVPGAHVLWLRCLRDRCVLYWPGRYVQGGADVRRRASCLPYV